MIRKVLVLTYFAQNITSDLSISVSLSDSFYPFFMWRNLHISLHHPFPNIILLYKMVICWNMFPFFLHKRPFITKQWSFYNLFIYQIIHPFIGCFNKTNVVASYEETKFAHLCYKVKYWTIYIDCSILQRLFYWSMSFFFFTVSSFLWQGAFICLAKPYSSILSGSQRFSWFWSNPYTANLFSEIFSIT